MRESGTTQPLLDIWGSDASNIFVVGDQGTILHSADHGVTWTAMPTGTTDTIFGVWGSSPTDVYAVALLGAVLHLE
jgi:photosystem II stability/assembly factor-like uncharacterized protein